MHNVKIIGGDTAANPGNCKDVVAVAAPAMLFSATAYNSSAGTVYLQVFDAAAAVADTTVPLMSQPVPTKQLGWIDWENGRPMAAGIYVCFSSTDMTKTIVLANSGLIDVVFRKKA